MRRCIPIEWLCVGGTSWFYGCGDGDAEGIICGGYGEQDKTCSNHITGEAVGWRCKTGSQYCIPDSFLCDGDQDCDDGEDEGEICG